MVKLHDPDPWADVDNIAEPLPIRRRYYKPNLSPDAGYVAGSEAHEPTDENPANIVSSLCTDGQHRPALDIDVPLEIIPSSTPGHCHLYFPTIGLDWDTYAALLAALGDAGILEGGYVNACLERGESLLRLPGVTKEPTLDEHKAAAGRRVFDMLVDESYPLGERVGG